MDGTRKKREDSDDLGTTPELSQRALATPEAVEPEKRKKRKKHKEISQQKRKKQNKEFRQDEMTALNKKIDELSNCVKEMTEIVKKLQKKSDVQEIPLKEKETPEKESVEEKRECCFESEDPNVRNPRAIFVKGLDCSFPRDEIETLLKKHFTGFGGMVFMRVFIPFHCTTGSHLGYAFVNVRGDEKVALALNGSYLVGMKLEVEMAIKRPEYSVYENHKGCERCPFVLKKRLWDKFYENRRFRIDPNPDPDSVWQLCEMKKQ